MSGDLERRSRALLRWYAPAWRARHGEVVLATMLDEAEARGLDRPRRADAWSMRLHGVATRATPRLAAVLAVLALVVEAALRLVDRLGEVGRWAPALVDAPSPWQVAASAIHLGLAPSAVGIAMVLVVAWRRMSPLAGLVACAALVAAHALVVAATVVALGAPSVETTSDGSTVSVSAPSSVAVAIAVAVLALGTLPFVHEILPRAGVAAWPVAVVLAIGWSATWLLLGGVGLVALVALAVVVIGLADPGCWSPRAPGLDPSLHVRASSAVGLLCLATVALALPTSAVVVLSASGLVRVDGDGLRAVVAVLLASGCTLAAAIAVAVRARVGAVAWVAAGIVGAAAMLASAAALLGQARPASGPLLAACAACLGLAAGVVVAASHRSRILHAALAVVVGTSIAVVLADWGPALLGIAWLGAVPLGMVALLRRRASVGALRAGGYGWQTGQR